MEATTQAQLFVRQMPNFKFREERAEEIQRHIGNLGRMTVPIALR